MFDHEISKLVSDAIEPVTKRLQAFEQAATAAGVKVIFGDQESDHEGSNTQSFSEALKDLNDRLGIIETKQAILLKYLFPNGHPAFLTETASPVVE